MDEKRLQGDCCSTSTGTIAINAIGNFQLTGIGASVGVGGTAGVGAGNFTLTHTDTVQALTGDNAIITANGGASLVLIATSREDLIGVSAAGAGGGSAGVAGSATVIVLDETTNAWIGRSANITANNGATAGTPGVSVTAVDNTTIASVAGSLAAGGAAAVGVGADITSLKKTTTAKIDSGVTANAEGNIVVTSDSLEDITSIAAGLAGSGGAAVAADTGVHALDITTRAWIGDDGRDGIATAGAGSIVANGSILVAADDRTEIDKVVGVAAGAIYASVGAAVGVSTTTKLTEAFIGDGAVVTALGNGSILAKTGEFTIGSTGSSVATLGIEPGSVSLSSSINGTNGLSAKGEVGLPKVNAMDVDRQGGNDANDSSIFSQRTAVPKTQLSSGLIVAATNRDDIEVYTISFAFGLVAVAVSSGSNVVESQTLASIGASAQINQTGVPNNAQVVRVTSGSDINQTAFGSVYGVGGSVAPTIGLTTIRETTSAAIGSNAVVSAKDDVVIAAYGSEDILLVTAGVASGAGLSASIGVLSFDNNTTATISSGARVLAGGDVAVIADDSSDIDVIAGAYAAGGVGVGAGVGVMTIDKNTSAIIDSNAIVDALGNGSATANVLTGEKAVGGGSYLRTNASGVIVQSTSTEDLTHFAAALGAGAGVGLAGGVSVTLVDSNTTARIGANAQINTSLGSTPNGNQSVYVNAANTLNAFTFSGAFGVGVVGLSGAVNVGILRNDTLAEIGSGAIVTARNDAVVSSLSIENIRGYTLGGAAGAVGLAASVSVWSVGSALEKNYSNENNSGSTTAASRNALEGNSGQRADTYGSNQAQGSSDETRNLLTRFDADGANPNSSSKKSVSSISNSAASRIAARAPTQASLQAKIDAGGAASGTTARITTGASVRVGDAILVTGDAGLLFTQLAGALAGGLFVGAGAGISVSTLANNSTAQAGGTLSAGYGGILVRSRNNEVNNASGVAGTAGFLGALGAAVVVLSDASVSQDGAIVSTPGPILVSSIDNRSLITTTKSIAIAGVLAAGASFSRINIKNDAAIETLASIGNSANLVGGSVTVEALPTINATADTTGVSGGLLIAATVNFAFVDAQPESRAMIGNSKIIAYDEVNVTSSMKTNLYAKGSGIAVSFGAAGMMYSDVNLGRGNNFDEVTAGVGGANIQAASLNIRANSVDKLLADAKAGVGGVIALAGSKANTSSDQATKTSIGSGATINVGTLGLYTNHDADIDSLSDAFTIAVGSGQAALAKNTNTGKANIDIGSNAIVNASEIRAKAFNYLVKNKADTSKPLADQYRLNINSQSFSLASLGFLSSDTDIGTTSYPLEAVVTFNPGSRVTSVSRANRLNVFEIVTGTNFEAADRVTVEALALGGSYTKGLSIIDAVTRSSVVANGASLINEGGTLLLSSRSQGSNNPESKLLAGSIGPSNAVTRTRADTTATSSIDLTNSTVKGIDVSLLAGKYNSSNGVDTNRLLSQSAGSILTFTALPNSTTNDVSSVVRENNFVNIGGASNVIGIRDVDLAARSGTIARSLIYRSTDAISVVPNFESDARNDVLQQTNQVNIADTSRIVGGAGSNVTYKILPFKIGTQTFLTLDRLNTPLTLSEKIALQLPAEADFVYAPLASSSISMPIQRGYIFHLVADASGGGTTGGYYRYVGEPTSIVVESTNFSSSLWQQLSQAEIDALPTSEFPVYESDITKNFALNIQTKFYIVKPADAPQPNLSLRNVGNLILKQYDDLIFIDMPALISSPGSVYIEQTGATASTFAGKLAGGQLKAHADAKIDIFNKSLFTMSTNGIELLASVRNVTVCGVALTLQPGIIYVNNQPLPNVSGNTTKSVKIVQDALNPTSLYDMTGLPPIPPELKQDLYINNGVHNQNGTVYIENKEGSIYVSGDVLGQDPVQIIANGNLSINSDGWYHLADPRQYLDFNVLDDDAKGPGLDRKIFDNASQVSDGTRTLAQAIAGNTSRIVSQGRLSLIAKFLNLNGLVQSGVDTIDVSISKAFVPPQNTITFSELADKYSGFVVDPLLSNVAPRKPTNIPGITFGVEDIPLDITWDADQKSFNFGKLDLSDGEIIIDGQILSTGGGKIKVASGYPSINIQNSTSYPVILDSINTSKNRKGKITIIDSDLLKKTEYLYDPNGVLETNWQGVSVQGRTDYGSPTIVLHAIGTPLTYQPKPGLQYVWTEGQTLDQTITETFQKKGFNLVGENFIADLLIADSQRVGDPVISLRGEPRRLLESQTRESPGAGIPNFAVDKAYTLDYVLKADSVVQVVKDVSLVRHPPSSSTGTVYRYIGNATKTVDLKTINYANDAEWVNSGNSAATFVADPSAGRFESDNRRITILPPVVSGGGWLSKKTITTIRKTQEGVKDFFTHTLKADYPIAIEVSRGVSAPNITINSAGGIQIAGNIEAPTNGSVSLTSSGGSIIGIDSVAIYANSPVLNANGQIIVQIEGDRGTVNATAGGSISITAISKDNLSSRLIAGVIRSSGGDVSLTAANGIFAAKASSLITGNRVELVALSSQIGSTASRLMVNSNAVSGRTDGGISAWAKDGITVTETIGDLVLASPVLLTSAIVAEASIQSDLGDVTLVSTTGSIRDGLFESVPSKPVVVSLRSSREQAYLNAALAGGSISPQGLAFPLPAQMMKFLYPHTVFLLQQPPGVVPERPNIKAAVVSLTAATSGAEIGSIGDRVAIANPQAFSSLPAAQAALLSSATPDDIIGVQYATYRYLGTAASGVDLKAEDYLNAGRWQRLAPNISTGPSDALPINRSLTTGQRVLIEFSSRDYGMYEYRGSAGTFDLVTQNYGDTSRWLKVLGAASTDGASANLTNGMLVTSKFTIDALTIRRVDDINIEASSGIIAIANARLALESLGNMRLRRLEAGNDVQLTSAANIIDVGIGDAAIASLGQVRLNATGTISGTVASIPLRTQIVPSGSLDFRSLASTNIQQVATDTTINGTARTINTLFVPRADSIGAMQLSVLEGDLLLGAVSSSTSVSLFSAGSVLDAYVDGLGRPANITTTPTGAFTGNVQITALAGSIGTLANPIDLVVGGELNSFSGTNTTVNHRGNLTARSMETTAGNINLVNTGNLLGYSMISRVGGITINNSGLMDLRSADQPRRRNQDRQRSQHVARLSSGDWRRYPSYQYRRTRSPQCGCH